VSETTALICLDTSIVAGTKADQAVWILGEAMKELDDITNRYALLDVTDDLTKVEAEHAVMDIRSKRKAWDARRKEWGAPLDLAKKTMDKAIHDGIDDPGRAPGGRGRSAAYRGRGAGQAGSGAQGGRGQGPGRGRGEEGRVRASAGSRHTGDSGIDTVAAHHPQG